MARPAAALIDQTYCSKALKFFSVTAVVVAAAFAVAAASVGPASYVVPVAVASDFADAAAVDAAFFVDPDASVPAVVASVVSVEAFVAVEACAAVGASAAGYAFAVAVDAFLADIDYYIFAAAFVAAELLATSASVFLPVTAPCALLLCVSSSARYSDC